MRLVTWNIRHGGGRRVKAIVDAVATRMPDVVVLTEYRRESWIELRDKLAILGWTEQACSDPPPRTNGILVAARVPLSLQPYDSNAPDVRERWLEFKVPSFGVTVVGLHIPLDGPKPNEHQQKKRFWEAILRVARQRKDIPCLMIGDFNTGRPEDCGGSPFKYSYFMDRLAEAGWTDTWRSFHPEDRDYTWFSHAGNGFRLDYGFANSELCPHVISAEHVHAWRTNGLSDHSGLEVDIAGPAIT